MALCRTKDIPDQHVGLNADFYSARNRRTFWKKQI